MNTQSAARSANDATAAHELFALTDEQILEIEPSQEVASDEWRVASERPGPSGKRALSGHELSTNHDGRGGPRQAANDSDTARAQVSAGNLSEVGEHGTRSTEQAVEPPRWLAEQMSDPRVGAEARELWDGVQRARQEAAAYREVFAKPEEARAAAERARTLEEIDAAFYGRAGKSAEDAGAARAVLAQRMMREDPAAFREMVFAGLRALEEAGASGRKSAKPGDTAGSASNPSIHDTTQSSQGPSTQSQPAASSALGMTEENSAAYREFERSANEELEKSVGSAIRRTIEAVLPNARGSEGGSSGGARSAGSLQERLAGAIRENVEAALKGDRQLGEQVAQILASRRFDDSARAQVVRLINDRAQQLVPSAARRVIDEWTQTTLTAHRGKSQKTENNPARADLAPTNAAPGNARTTQPTQKPSGRVDYRKLSDEQILDL